MTPTEIDLVQQKYIDARHRFRMHFIAVDSPDNAGSNIPVNFRNLWGRGSGVLGFSDSTIQIAYYISLLATEIFVACRENTNTRQLFTELDFAIGTLERLDSQAEKYYRKSGKAEISDLNGFFIRDDVPVDFLERYPKLKEAESPNHAPIFRTAYNIYNDKPDGQPIVPDEMSQDQCWHLYLGIALACELLYKVKEREPKLLDLITRLKLFVSRTARYMIRVCDGKIINPITYKPVLRGSDMTMFLYGFAKAAERITGNDYDEWLHPFSKMLFHSMTSFADGVLYPYVTKVIKRIPVKDYSYKALSIVGDCWHNDNLMSHICKMFDKTLRYPHFPLFYYIINSSKRHIPIRAMYNFKKLEDLLVTYNGSFNFYDPVHGSSDIDVPRTVFGMVPGVNVPVNPIWRWDLLMGDYNVPNEKERWDLGSYSGIDFMLLWNLWKVINLYSF